GNEYLSSFNCWVVDLHPGPEIELYRLTDERERGRDHGLAGDDGSKCSYDDTDDQEPFGHELIEWIGQIGIPNHSFLGKQESALSDIIKQQAGLDEDPGKTDIRPPAMTHIGVEGLSPGSAEENSAKQPEPFRVGGEELYRIVGIECLQYREVIR